MSNELADLLTVCPINELEDLIVCCDRYAGRLDYNMLLKIRIEYVIIGRYLRGNILIQGSPRISD